MNNFSLSAISPVDGRYQKITSPLGPYFSEFGLFRYRIIIEIEYFIHLVQLPLPQLSTVEESYFEKLRDIYRNFDIQGAERIKEIEKVTNHDVKAVEYYLKEKFDSIHLGDFKEFIHFGLTSQDINNTATPLLLRDGCNDLVYPKLEELQGRILHYGKQWENIPMIGRTHGQPASPTRLGKEMLVFHERITRQLHLLKEIPFPAKFGGATGNFNAHFVAYPDIDWHDFAERFIAGFGLKRSFPTTQIEHYDYLAAFFDGMKRINTILIDFSRDVWQYISMEFFKQRIAKNETGSSTMPHKVNPIDFENAEGNLGLANAIYEHLSAKLPISRLQRDLSDSTVLRNIGVPLAHSYLAYVSLIKGMGKIELNEDKIREDLENNWVVVGEGIQTVLRREGYPEPFEALKSLTRKNEKVTRETMVAFIDSLEIPEKVKAELKNITPFTYVGR
ncbi:MAG: adenylosuccinate lyase [Cyclobacteriaceae bacterium]|nr:adenylosuccinate lyase [Cyclobacteriaceae bacterium]